MSDTKVVMIYGRAGCGKTTAIANLAGKGQFGHVHFVNMDHDGIDSAKDEKHEFRPGITATTIKSIAELDKEWKRLERRTGVAEECQTIVFDSFSMIDLRVVAHVADSRGGTPFELAQMNKQKWGKRTQIINAHILGAFQMPYRYVIFTAHEKSDKNDDGQTTSTWPSVGSENSQAIADGALSAIIHMQLVGRDMRRLTCNYHPIISAKCRSAAVKAMLDTNGQTTKPLHEVLINL